jgi:hypothetical protein
MPDFTPLVAELDGHFDKPFADLSPQLQERVATTFPPIGDSMGTLALQDGATPSWDALSPDMRRQWAAHWDHQGDPTTADERARVWGLEVKIRERTREAERLEEAAKGLVGAELDRVHEQTRQVRDEIVQLEKKAGVPAADKATSADDEISALFDPVKREALEKMFPARKRWAGWCEHAAENKLITARVKRGLFNPYLAGRWFLGMGLPEWSEARLMRVLANNLPPRSRDKAELLLLNSED